MASPKSNRRWDLRVNVKILRPAVKTPLAGQVAAMFFDNADAEPPPETLYDDFRLSIRSGQIVAAVGPSGAGKSLLLDEVRRQIRGAVLLGPDRPGRSNVPAVELVPGRSLAERLEILSLCGLAEATAMICPPERLSGGQRHRLALAVALGRARLRRRPTLVIADELASSLDPVTAVNLCRRIRKLISGSDLALLAATPQGELLDALKPDLVVTKPLAEPARTKTPARRRRRRMAGGLGDPACWPVSTGSIADYERLGRFHYIAGPPAAHKRVYVIAAPAAAGRYGGPALAALLVVSPPLINVRGRNLATAGRYCTADRRAGMDLLNREIECISRVIVHPIYRGCRLAVRLVRHALATARTPLTEALAAMGQVNPFFVKAGMRAYHIGLGLDAARLVSAGEAVGLGAADFAAVEPVRKLLRRHTKASRFLAAEIDRCLSRSAASKHIKGPGRKGPSVADPVAVACRQVTRQYVYYLAETWRKNRCRKT